MLHLKYNNPVIANPVKYGAKALYDPSDLSTLFQDEAGTTPVTAVEQPVSLMLDKSGNGHHASTPAAASTSRPTLSARYNQLLNSNGDLSTTSWFGFNSATISNNNPGGILPEGLTNCLKSVIAVGQTNGAIGQSVTLKLNTQYRLDIYTYKPSSNVSANSQLNVYYNNGSSYAIITSSTYTESDQWIKRTITFTSNSTYTNHIISYGRLASLATPGDAYYCCLADLKAVNDSNVPYQRVNTSTDYDSDSTKFPYYLLANGTNTYMKTASFAWGSDKMVGVFGVRKLRGGARGFLAEFSGNADSNNGAFILGAPAGETGQNLYLFNSRGTSIGSAFTLDIAYTEPISNIFTGKGDISGDIAQIRLNSTVIQTTTTNQGTGDYGTYEIYFFSRAGTSLFFLGRFYGCALYNKSLATSRVKTIENYYKNKMKLVY